ncbi:hypothetical protein GIB67_013001 [Kingdonia uniflora]|uniref:F-box domain-containing protein n=1 Tax=Kingdonia uniflora TaxID=39325 RepID=A0A7J7MCQ6_9MAGN|nr:hypothetical protein GIB67_013001 [Kingdonia uniflora]
MTNNHKRFLPKEIIRNVLMRVPIEALITFKFVCMLWFKLISDSGFQKAHRLRNSQSKIMIFKAQVPRKSESTRYDQFSISCNGEGGRRVEEMQLRRDAFMDDNVELVACCDDLLLFERLNRISQLYIGDPYTRRCTMLPPLNSNYFCHWTLIQDVYTKKYKVVGISFIYDRCFMLTLENNLKAKNPWREMYTQLMPAVDVTSGTLVFAYGKIHWLSEGLHISSLDVAREELRVMPGPSCVRNQCLCSLSEANSSLYVTAPSTFTDQLEIWCLKYKPSGMWVKEYNINLVFLSTRPRSLISFAHCLCTVFSTDSILGGSSDGMQVLIDHQNQLFVYDLQNRKLTLISSRGDEERLYILPFTRTISNVPLSLNWSD